MMKTLLVAATLAAAPLSAFAMCSDKSHQAMSCTEGTVWDAQSQTCVAQISS
jgi:hypothetical protein